MNYVVVKLINDKEVIGEYMAEDDYLIWLKNPLEVRNIVDMSSGVMKCVLDTYLPFAKSLENGMPFPKMHVIQCLPIEDNIKKYYFNSLTYIDKNKINDFDEDINRLDNDFSPDTIEDSGKYIHKNLSKAIH